MKDSMWVVNVLCFLAYGALGDVGMEECSEGKAPNNFGDDTEEKMNVELLQKDLTLRKHLDKTAESGCEAVKIKGFPPCLVQGYHNGSFQATSKNYEHANLSQWDQQSGEWRLLFQLDASSTVADTGKKFRNINSCAINNLDNALYCSVQMDDGSFLARIGNETKTNKPTVGFLAKLRQWRWAATFDEHDNYYVYGEEEHELGTLNMVSGVSNIDAFASYRCEGVQKNKFDEYGSTEKVKVNGQTGHQQKIYLGADFAFMEKDGEKYLAALAGTDMKLLKITKRPFELIHVTTSGLPTYPMKMHPYKRVWGTAWSHHPWKNLYFSGDDGAGVYALSLKDNLDMAAGTAKFVPFGEAVETDWNDGFSCGKDIEYEPKSKCVKGKMYRSSTKDRKSSNPASEIFVVDEKDGSRKNGFKVEAAGLTGINACAMNPKDDMIYCILRFDKASHSEKNLIARIDDEGTVGYVMRVEGSWAFSGVFDDDGTFYFYEPEFGLHHVKELHNILPASKYPSKAVWPLNTRLNRFKWEVGADFAILKHNKKVYLASIMAGSWSTKNGKPYFPPQKVSLIDITGGKVADEVIYLEEEGEVLPKPKDSEDIQKAGINAKEITYGTAWKSVDSEILFADDSGIGIWKLLPESVSIIAGKGTVKFEKKEKMKNYVVEWNDGFVCDPDVNKDPEKVKVE